ncbi:type VI secretion system tip protein VgrG [Massilia forsythiae]|uniref:Type VI secretion system tip protein VgrG n=1 Tax=Massilia forsythiae TaxID=2728020 RepID=A0A7Z2ZR97_9BURK|nr:type VI secretion system Vgr family protein [Massilia forsythiae]QJD99232.1 type VI secretion system tip protein VgrG [Massilia forsythiae]
MDVIESAWRNAIGGLSDKNRPIGLRLWNKRVRTADPLLVQHVSGVETMCGGIDYTLLCVSIRAGLPLKEFIANPAELQFVTDKGDLRCVCGIVVAVAEGQSDGGLATYRLVVRDAFALLDKTCNTRVFRDVSEIDITTILLKEWRAVNPVAAHAFDFELRLSKTYPPRGFTLQYNESTAAFLRRLWKRRGIAWFIRPGALGDLRDGDAPCHTLVLFDDAMALKQNAAGTVRFHRDAATETRDTVTAWHAARSLTPGSTAGSSYDYLRGGTATSEDTGLADQGALGNRFAASLDDYLVDVPHAGADGADYRSLGRARMLRHEYEAKFFHGEGSVRDMRVGEWNGVSGHPELDTHPERERVFVITELCVDAENNLPKTLDDRVRRLFARNGWHAAGQDDDAGLAHASAERGVRYTNRFTCVRRGIPIVPRYDPRVDLPRTELQYVTVVGPVNEEIHCDHLGRVKVRFPGCRPEDHEHAHGAGASGTDRDSAWVQVASPWAGDGYGTISLPRVGHQVLCAFVGGDPDKPLIIGRAHGGQAPPPSFSRVSLLPGDRYLSGIVSKEGGAYRYNQLRLDDTPGQISAQLASVHGQTQLNLGYLTHPRREGKAEARGQGFELASDESGTIRTAKSLLVSAWKRLGASGTQLSASEHLALMQDCLDLFKTLGQYATEHQGLPVDPVPQAALKSDLDVMPGAATGDPCGVEGKPTLSLTAPAGIAFSTPKTIVSYAGVNLDSVAQQHMQLASGQRFNLNAGKGISLFAHAGGITQVAHHGVFLMQSQHDDMKLDAARDLKASAHGRVVFMAEQEVTFIVGGGAYLTLKGGNAEIGGPGVLTVKTAGHHWDGPASGKADLPSFGKGDFERTPRLLRATDGKPVPDMQAQVEQPDAGTLSGASNAAGEGPQVKADRLQQLKAVFRKVMK